MLASFKLLSIPGLFNFLLGFLQPTATVVLAEEISGIRKSLLQRIQDIKQIRNKCFRVKNPKFRIAIQNRPAIRIEILTPGTKLKCKKKVNTPFPSYVIHRLTVAAINLAHWIRGSGTNVEAFAVHYCNEIFFNIGYLAFRSPIFELAFVGFHTENPSFSSSCINRPVHQLSVPKSLVDHQKLQGPPHLRSHRTAILRTHVITNYPKPLYNFCRSQYKRSVHEILVPGVHFTHFRQTLIHCHFPRRAIPYRFSPYNLLLPTHCNRIFFCIRVIFMNRINLLILLNLVYGRQIKTMVILQFTGPFRYNFSPACIYGMKTNYFLCTSTWSSKS